MEEEGRLPIRGSRKRPGFGTVGRRFVLNANRFLVSLAAEHLHCYSVSIVTEVGTQSTCRAILASLIAENRQSHLGGRFPACGGRSNLYTAGPLAFASKDFDVVLGGGGEGGDVTRMKRRLKVPIGLARSVDRCSANVPAQVLQAASVVLRAMIGEQRDYQFERSSLKHSPSPGGAISDCRDVSSVAFIDQPQPLIHTVEVVLKRNITDQCISHDEFMELHQCITHVSTQPALGCTGTTTREGPDAVGIAGGGKILPDLKQNMKRVMFYC